MEGAFRDAYTSILHEEIALSAGGKEPLAIAYCSAKAHEVLGMQPTAVTVSVSGGVLKNVKGAVIPNTNGLTGIRAAVAAGIVCGRTDKGMQVIGDDAPEQRAAIVHFMDTVHIDVATAETECALYISVTLYARTSYVRVVIADSPSNIVEIMKNGEAILKRPIAVHIEDNLTDKSCLNPRDIVTYADQVDLSSVKPLLDLQVRYNMTICEEGLANECGANIGRILLAAHPKDAETKARAYAAAGIDARMNGCELPVAALCGSDSQGIAAAVPVLCYAKHYGIAEERTYRALLVSDLLTVYRNHTAERQSDCCGAVHAGCAAGAGIAYLLEADAHTVSQTLANSVAMCADMICDGAKPSCAVKIAAAVGTGILGYRMLRHQRTHQSD